MRERLPRNPRRRRIIRITTIGVVFVCIGLLLPKAISIVSAFVMAPVHGVHTWLQQSSSALPVFIRDRSALHDRIVSLEHELAVSQRSSITQQRLLEENNRLRSLLSISDDTRVAAGVIARPDTLPYDLLQIDRGYNHGIEIGAPVFIGQDSVIGLIVHTADKYSFVQLITSPGFTATAFIAGPNIIAPLEGMGGGIARVRVPQGVPMTTGNVVHLPSVDPGTFGRVSYIENRPTQPEQFGYIAPDLALSSIHMVAVGTLSQRAQSVAEIDEHVRELLNTALYEAEISIPEETATTSSEQNTPNPTE